MTLKKLLASLVILAISAFAFTACEDDTDTPVEPAINVEPVGNTYAGQVGTGIQVLWTVSPSHAQTWFKGYHLTVTTEASSTPILDTVIPKASTNADIYYTFNSATPGTVYAFNIAAVGTQPATDTSEAFDKESGIKSITWAAATHFAKDDTQSEIKIYTKESSDLGSGLQLYNATNAAPYCSKLANISNWNLALGSKTNLIFGSASIVAAAMAWTTGTPADAEISDIIGEPEAAYNAADPTALLNGPLLDRKLNDANMGWAKKAINLATDAKCMAAVNGIIFYARTAATGNYAKIVVLKKNGTFLQDANSNNPYIHILVSYQKTAGVPYAKQ